MHVLPRTSYTRRGGVARAFLLVLAVGGTLAEARGPDSSSGVANYTFDTHYELRPGAAEAFDRYWAALRDHSHETTVVARYVDAVADPDRLQRVVSLPVERLAEYGAERRNEEVLRAALGDEAASAIIDAFNGAQASRTSYLRQYRNDLSVNRERYGRAQAAEVALVTVIEGKEAAFERAWRRAVDAFRAVAPDQVIAVARTLVGGGPQFLIVRPHRDGRSAPMTATDAVRAAQGEQAARDFEGELRRLVAAWETSTRLNAGLDTTTAAREARR
jgi:hypothetical protein